MSPLLLAMTCSDVSMTTPLQVILAVLKPKNLLNETFGGLILVPMSRNTLRVAPFVNK